MTCLMTWLMTGRCGPSVDEVDDDSAPTCRMTWPSSQARIPALTGFSGRFPAKLRRALQGSFQLRFRRSLYRRTRIDERNLCRWSKPRFENFKNSTTLNRELKNVFFSVQASLMLWYQFVVHTGPKANTNKNTNKQIYVVPQNRVRPWRQQIIYYWRNDTNTQLNPVQSQKTQGFTLTLTHSLKSALFHSHTLPLSVHTCTHTALSMHSFTLTHFLSLCTLAHTLHSLCTLSSLSLFTGSINIMVDGGEGGWEKCW